MKKYYSFFKLKFTTGLQYRAAALGGLATQLFFGFVFIMVYHAFYSSGDSDLNFTIRQLTTYMWLGQIFYSLVSIPYRDNELLNIIKNGDMAYELCRPVNLYIMWFIRILSSKLSSVLLRSLPLIPIIIFLPSPYNIDAPYSLLALLLFIIALLIASLLVTALISLIYIITSITIDDKGIMGIYFNIAEIMGGNVVPLPLLPSLMKLIASLLPFAYVGDFAFRIYTGNIIGIALIYGFIIQISWLIILILFGMFITKKVTNRVVVQGG